MIQAAIGLILLVYGGLFVVAGRRTRALLVLTSIFIANLELEVGVGLNAPVVLSILATVFLLSGRSAVHPRCRDLFSNRLLLFFVWVCVVSCVGMFCLDTVHDARYGWTRNSNVKPLVQLVRLLVLAPLAMVIADGIRSRADARWFLTNWTRIAVISASLCILQVGVYELTGTSLGTYRVHAREFELTFASIGSETLMRASGLAGEPKAQGAAMAMSLCMLLATYGRDIVACSRRLHLVCIVAVEVALLLTWSSGALAMTGILFGLVLLTRPAKHTKIIVAVHAILLTVVLTLVPTLAGAIWKSRLTRIVDIACNVHASGYGEEKERPAMRYLLAKPHLALAGVGMGMGPYHFDRFVKLADFRRKYVDPNCGIVWGIYGFGLVGCCLLLAGLMPEFRGSGMAPCLAPVNLLVLRFAILYFIVATPLWWLVVAAGLACAPGTQQQAAIGSVLPAKLVPAFVAKARRLASRGWGERTFFPRYRNR